MKIFGKEDEGAINAIFTLIEEVLQVPAEELIGLTTKNKMAHKVMKIRKEQSSREHVEGIIEKIFKK